MKDLASYMLLGFKHVHELSEAALDMESRPEIRRHPAHAAVLADEAVTALAHMAAASAAWRYDAQAATQSVAEARHSLARLKRGLTRITDLKFITCEESQPLVERIEEALALLLVAGTLLRTQARLVA